MSNKERAIQLIEGMPEHELIFVIDLLENLKTCIRETIEPEEVEPDEWDLEMIARAERENDGQGIAIEDLAAELGITL